jgi:glycerophosphoryl diester phosphodiesterase
MGARHLELDVHLTSDGHAVVIHDDTVDRTTDGTGPVAGQSLAALRRLDAGGWFHARFAGERIPTLQDVIARYGARAHLHVELKGRSDGLTRRTVDAIRDGGMADRVTITSFQRVRLEEARAYAPELATGWLVAEPTEAIVAQARAIGLTQLCPKASTLTPDLVRRLRAEGFGVRAWGVENEDLMRQVVSAGADGMTVNFPDKLIAYLEGSGA